MQQHEQAAHLAFTTRLVTAALCDAGSPCHPHPACLANVQGSQADQEAKVREGSRWCCQVPQAWGGLFSCHPGQRSCRPHWQDWRHSAYTVHPQESCKSPGLACVCCVTLFTHAICIAGAVAKSACLIRSFQKHQVLQYFLKSWTCTETAQSLHRNFLKAYSYLPWCYGVLLQHLQVWASVWTTQVCVLTQTHSAGDKFQHAI